MWCVPCINSLPDLKALYDTFSKRNIGFLGIAYDKSENLEKIKQLITKYGIDWSQSLVFSDTYTIVDKYKIEIFPIFLIVDNNGNVLFKTSGENGLKEVRNYFLFN
ncbi:MAG: TlpA family protein disulfide reductase [Flavisolibacter sp.]